VSDYSKCANAPRVQDNDDDGETGGMTVDLGREREAAYPQAADDLGMSYRRK
jgi:hypothetical protein